MLNNSSLISYRTHPRVESASERSTVTLSHTESEEESSDEVKLQSTIKTFACKSLDELIFYSHSVLIIKY